MIFLSSETEASESPWMFSGRGRDRAEEQSMLEALVFRHVFLRCLVLGGFCLHPLLSKGHRSRRTDSKGDVSGITDVLRQLGCSLNSLPTLS